MKSQYLKIFFGLAIFLFASALSYFTADYLSSNSLLDYWGTLALFAGIYVLLGIIVATVFPISLGFLFSADVLIINILLQYYGEWGDLLKCLLVGVILLALYMATWIKLKDQVAQDAIISV